MSGWKIRTLSRIGDISVPKLRMQSEEPSAHRKVEIRLVYGLKHEFGISEIIGGRLHIGIEKNAGTRGVVQPGIGDADADLIGGPSGDEVNAAQTGAKIAIDLPGLGAGVAESSVVSAGV